jgi:hypothetical protein
LLGKLGPISNAHKLLVRYGARFSEQGGFEANALASNDACGLADSGHAGVGWFTALACVVAVYAAVVGNPKGLARIKHRHVTARVLEQVLITGIIRRLFTLV